MFGRIVGEMQEALSAAKIKSAAARRTVGDLKLKPVDRNQFRWLSLDVDTLVALDHKARAIWDLTGRLDLSQFLAGIQSRTGQAGREHSDPRLLVSIWLYAYSEAINSAREVSRQMEYEPGLRWLAALELLSHTTLSEFRKAHRQALDDLFTELLAALEAAGHVNLEQIMQDGTKVQAQASSSSFRREKTLQERLERARQIVKELGDPDEDEKQSRGDAIRRRTARERAERLEQALAEIKEIQSASAAANRAGAKVSVTEPEARFMKHGNHGGILPSYNVQITTDAQAKVIMGYQVTQNSSDAGISLPQVLEEVKVRLKRRPKQVVTDGAYTGHRNIVHLAQAGVDLIGPVADLGKRQAGARKSSGVAEEFAGERFLRTGEENRLVCPQGKHLGFVRINSKRGNIYEVYQAQGSDCRECASNQQCCPKGFEQGRSVSVLIREQPEVVAFRERMRTEAAQAAYKKRGEVAETPNAWIKEKFGMRKLRLRGKVKASTEILWACLTYNVMQWIRLVWRGSKHAGLQPA
jgi:transposase